MHTPILHPTDFTAFRKMVAEMSIMELDEYEAVIHLDILKYIESQAQRHYIEEWGEKIKIIAETRKQRRETIHFDNTKAA